jgi:hypothetical protein
LNATLNLSPRRLVLLGLVGLVAVLTLGFAAANTVPGSNAGDGSGTVSGYTVTNIHYTLDSTNPSNTTQVGFTLNPALSGTGTSRLSLNGGTTWLAAGACSGTTNVTCTAAVAVTSLTNLRIVAAD